MGTFAAAKTEGGPSGSKSGRGCFQRRDRTPTPSSVSCASPAPTRSASVPAQKKTLLSSIMPKRKSHRSSPVSRPIDKPQDIGVELPKTSRPKEEAVAKTQAGGKHGRVGVPSERGGCEAADMASSTVSRLKATTAVIGRPVSAEAAPVDDRVRGYESQIAVLRDEAEQAMQHLAAVLDLSLSAHPATADSTAPAGLRHYAVAVASELRRVRADHRLLRAEADSLRDAMAGVTAELVAARAEVSEARSRSEELEQSVVELERRLQELSTSPKRPRGGAVGVYVAFDTQLQQEQYRPNVSAILALLTDPPAEIKEVVWEPSALPAQPGLVLLYVTYCPNPRLCVHASRLQAFTDLPGVTVVFLILKRGVNSQLTDVRSARQMVPCLPPAVLHYGIDGTALVHPDTPAGKMNVRSSEALAALLRPTAPSRTDFPPSPPPTTTARYSRPSTDRAAAGRSWPSSRSDPLASSSSSSKPWPSSSAHIASARLSVPPRRMVN